MTNLEERLIKLENQIRNYRISSACLAIAVIAFVLISSSEKNEVPDIIKAKAFQVVDDGGNALVLMNKQNGNGHLSTYSPAGKTLVKLYATTGRSAGAINTYDIDGDINVKINSMTNGGGYMAIFNQYGKRIIESGSTNSKSGYLKLNGPDNNRLAYLSATTQGGASLSLGYNGDQKVQLSSGKEGILTMYNDLNKKICYLGGTNGQNGQLSIYNKYGSYSGGIPK